MTKFSPPAASCATLGRDGGITRRDFIRDSALLGAGTLAAGSFVPAAVPRESIDAASSPTGEFAVVVALRINGEQRRLAVDTRTTLLDALREHLRLTGSKKGCDHGQCGACTVLVNGERVNACLSFLATHDGDEITTIEGLAREDELHPLQAAFIRCDGFQCGYCTPGQIMSAVALLREGCPATDEGIREMMSGNLCRCGAYNGMIEAIRQTRDRQSL